MTAAMRADWLVVIDMQTAFGDPDSPWFCPAFEAAAANIRALLPLFEPNVVFTRFVPPRAIEGSWDDYYRKWPFAVDRSSDDPWQLVAPWRGMPSVDSHRFSKWIPALQRIVGGTPKVTLCGVSTDCCVMGTALAAVDDGAFVRVVADACGAKTPDIHAAALDLLSKRAPQLVISSLDEEKALRIS